MDVDFINAYTEVLTENFDAVIKQNFIFQTKLKLTEKNNRDKEDLIAQLDEIKKQREELQNQIEFLNATVVRTENVREKAGEVDNANAERTRIQNALNEAMQKVSKLETEVAHKNALLADSKTKAEDKLKEVLEYVTKLEEVVPVSKLKKLNPEAAAKKTTQNDTVVDDAIEQTPIDNLNKVEIQSGGTF